ARQLLPTTMNRIDRHPIHPIYVDHTVSNALKTLLDEFRERSEGITLKVAAIRDSFNQCLINRKEIVPEDYEGEYDSIVDVI
ncbi:hypothetical protein PMAYCL1PPCAC_01250, partial [Pristionchus mayeri]